jgi:predicted neutral ceramidase superfamily lipid hydrolase
MEQQEEKDRFSVDMTPGHHEALASLAKQFKITQGEVVECLLDAHNQNYARDDAAGHTFNQLAIQKRQAKVAAREQSRALYKQFKEQQKAAVAS